MNVYNQELLIKTKITKSMFRLDERTRCIKKPYKYSFVKNVLMSYYGILSHVESDGLMRWISENFVLQKNRDEKLFCQKVRTKNERKQLSNYAKTYDSA